MNTCAWILVATWTKPENCVEYRMSNKQIGEQAGFSLLEITLVVAIAMVFMGISIGTLVPALNSYRIKSDAQAIAGLISLARLRAEANFAHASLICSSTAQPNSCQVQVTTSGSATPVTEPQQKILSTGISFATFV